MAGSDLNPIDRLRQGDETALRSLLERHGPVVWRDIQSDIGGRWQALIDADDVMQVTYLEAFLEAPRITASDETGFVAWLRRIAKNNLHDAIKELSRQKRPDSARKVEAPATDDSYAGLVAYLGATSSTPSRHAAAGEARHVVQRLLDELPPDYARVVRLYDLEGRDVDEVAGELGRSRGAVHMLRARAHDRLRTLLGSMSNYLSH